MTTPEVWVLVADAAGARVLRADRAEHRLELLRTHTHPAGRAKPSERVTDRAGRSFDSTHAGGRHAMEPDTDLRRAELRRFAHQLASELDQAAVSGSFDQLVIVAGDRMLGELRDALPQRVKARVRQEIGKDLAGLEIHPLTEHLAPDLWP